MKRIINLILAGFLLLLLTACSGNYAQIDLNEPIQISDEGIIEKSVLDRIKEDGAIATFSGTSSDLTYEWTVFGSDLTETKDVDLSLDLKRTSRGLEVLFGKEDALGFPALLSIHLNEKWTADSATAYQGEKPVYSVSITGSKTSILNLSVSNMTGACVIVPDVVNYGEASQTESAENVQASTSADELPAMTYTEDDYLSSVGKGEDKVYTGYDKNAGQNSGGAAGGDNYLSDVTAQDDRVYSDGNATNQDKYQTDPVPEGKPMPVEPEDQEINNQKTYTCTFSIECATILNNLKDLDPDKRELIPSNGVILAATTVTFYEGESVYDVLQRVCRENGIHLESSWTPIYNSAYIEGIHNLYEFDCGQLSGWVYRVNGWYPNYGCSRYQLADKEVVEWRYTCDLGKDVGCDWME